MSLKFRPFAVMGFIALSVMLGCIFFTDKTAIISVAAGLFIFIISLVLKKIREKIFPFYIASALMFSGVMFVTVNENNLKYAQQFIGETTEIEGVVTEKPTFKNSRYYYVLELETIDGQPINSKLRLSLPNAIDAEPYDSVKLSAKIYEISAESEDIQLYYRSKGIFLGAYVYNSDETYVDVIKRSESSLGYNIFLIREEIKSRLFDKLPNENGATVIAMLLGDKTDLPTELNDKFREAGIAPIFAVSGLHLSVWVMGLYGLLSQLGIKKRLNSVIEILFTVFFMLLTGLSPSVCRSGVMLLLMLSGNLFHRRADSLNSLGFAAFILCAINPYIAADTGFLMSFSATLGIVTLTPIADEFVLSRLSNNTLMKPFKSVLTAIVVSVSATIGVFPVTVFFIGYISLFSILTNLLVTYAATACMVLGGLTAITYNIDLISDFLSLIAGLLSKYLLFIVDFICNLPTTMLSTDNIFWKIGVIFTLAVLAFSLLNFKGKALAKSLSVGVSAIILTCSLSSYFYYDGLTQLRVLDVDNGVAVVAFNDNHKIVIAGKADGYYKSATVTDNLNSISRDTADMFIITDLDGAEDYANLDIIQTVDFDRIIVPQSSVSLESVSEASEIIETNNALIEVWDGGSIQYVCCDDYTLAHCDFNGTNALILFKSKRNAEIPKEYLTADYLICSGYIPNCISPEAYRNVVVCGDEKSTKTICDYVRSSGGSPVATDTNDSVRINIREKSQKIFVLE